MYPDPGAMDLPSLPGADPSQSPASTQPGPAAGPGDPSAGGVPSSVYNPAPGSGTQDATPFYGATDVNSTTSPVPNGMIPLGGGMYYDPVTDAIHGMPTSGGGNGLVGPDGKF